MLAGAGAAIAIASAPASAGDQFQYDALGRLTRVTYASGAVVLYSYDAAGNRTTVIADIDGQIPPPPNRAPVAVNDTGIEVERDTTVSLFVMDNDSDPDSDPLTITSVSGPGASIGGGGAYIRYAAGSVGNRNVGYTISDGRGGTAGATASIFVYRTFPSAAAGEEGGSAPDSETETPDAGIAGE